MSKSLESGSSEKNLVRKILQTEKLYVKCCERGERVHKLSSDSQEFLT